MLRLKDIPPEQMPEVVRIANQLYEKDQRVAEQDQERESYVNAAEELGVPKEYLERAAAELHRQRVVEAQDKQVSTGKNATIAAALVAAGLAFLLVGGLYTTRSATLAPPRAVMQSAPPQVTKSPIVRGTAIDSGSFEEFGTGSEVRWTLDRNAGTQAQVSYVQEGERGQVAVVRVDRFGAVNGMGHRANFDSILAPAIAGKQQMSFDMRGEGLRKVRVYLEMGNQVRWRSQELTIPSGWNTFRVNLSNFERQVPNGSGRWRNEGGGRPDVVTSVSFKFGEFMNQPSDKGEVRLDNLRFE